MDRHGGVPLGELTPGPDGAVDAERGFGNGVALLLVIAVVLGVVVWLGSTVVSAFAAGCGGG